MDVLALFDQTMSYSGLILKGEWKSVDLLKFYTLYLNKMFLDY